MSVDEAILKLVDGEAIEDQATLRERLRVLGHQVTQPTLSRHLKRLNVRKELGVYRLVSKPAVTVPEFTLSPVRPNLVVMRTRPGHAQVLAVLLDSKNVAGVAGTVAGDDTVFVATAEADLGAFGERVRTALNGRKRPD